MTVEAGDALFGQDGSAAGAEAPRVGPPKARAAPATGPSPAAAPADAEAEAPAEPARAEAGPDAAPPPAPTWLTGRATTPWPPPGAAGPRVRAAGAIPPPRRPTAGPRRPAPIPGPPPMPRVVEEPAILGLSRLTRGRFGSRLFTWFFLLVFALIAGQMVVSILYPW